MAIRMLVGVWQGAIRNRHGATTAEYALLLALVVIILIGTLSQLGQALNGRLQDIIASLNAAK